MISLADAELVTLTVAVGRLAAFARDDKRGGDAHDEENTYGLPEGRKLGETLKEWFRRQKARILGSLPSRLAPIPTAMPSLTDWDDPMARAMVPVLGPIWDESGKEVRARLGLDPDGWQVTSPHLQGKIHNAAYNFCHATNATTSKSLNVALNQLRGEMAAGIAVGDTLDELVKRVGRVFEHAEEYRARRIAVTESSRAFHDAAYTAAVESGVVQGFELLLSSDACPLCRKIATECKATRPGQPLAIIGDNPAYREVMHPPLHPGCQCTMVEILSPSLGGPPAGEVPFGPTLNQPQKGLEDGYDPPAGKEVPKPEPERVAKPEPEPRPEK